MESFYLRIFDSFSSESLSFSSVCVLRLTVFLVRIFYAKVHSVGVDFLEGRRLFKNTD